MWRLFVPGRTAYPSGETSMDETTLKKPAAEVRQVLEHYLTTGQKFNDTPDADPGLADFEVKFKKWSADAAASIRRCFDPPAVAERFLKIPRRKGIWREVKIVTRYRNLLHAYEYKCDYIKELKGTMGIYESPTSNAPKHELLTGTTKLSSGHQQTSISVQQEYDVALSYAGEDKAYVEAVAHALRRKSLRVFYDSFEEADLIGRNLIDHLSEIYQNKARLCIVFVSAAYARKPFPRLERQAAQARAMEGDQPYIIPVRLDDSEIPGLLSSVAYVSGKTPEGLAQLIASKLLLTESPGIRTPESPFKGDAVVLRFNSLLEPDMDRFRETLGLFEHWADHMLWSIPVELRVPQQLLQQIDDARAFRSMNGWLAPAISDEARQQFSKFYDEEIPRFFERTIKGIQRLISYYRQLGTERLTFVAKRWLITRIIVLARLLLKMRLVGMPQVQWEPLFAQFGFAWSDWVMHGLPYASFIDGEEQFLWIDTNLRDENLSLRWQRFRLYAPAEFLVMRDHETPITPEQFDGFFAIQLLIGELDGEVAYPLQYFALYPDRLELTVRGEWAIETKHFEQHSTTNSGGKPLFTAVLALRDHVVNEVDRKGLPKGQKEMNIHKIASLFQNRGQFKSILWE